MPFTVVVTSPEADALRTAEVPGISGNIFTYSPHDGPAILALVEHEQEAWERLASRMTAISVQAGYVSTFFQAHAEPDPVAEPVWNLDKMADMSLNALPPTETNPAT